MDGLVLIMIIYIYIYIHAVINYCPYISMQLLYPSLNIGVGKASLQQFESEIQQNPNAVWCIWIPQPVRITLPACQGCYDFVL